MAEFEADAVLAFPQALPGFPDQTEFVVVQREPEYPLVYLQSTRTPDLCFLAIPVLSAAAGYALDLTDDDARLLDVPERPAIGEHVLCLALVSMHPNEPTANLFAPIVVNLRTRVAAQCFQASSQYSHQHPLLPDERGVAA